MSDPKGRASTKGGLALQWRTHAGLHLKRTTQSCSPLAVQQKESEHVGSEPASDPTA
jgi:hypothetical protein